MTMKQSNRDAAWGSTLHKMLGEAVFTMMCNHDDRSLARAFVSVSDGLASARGAPYVANENAQRWIRELGELMKPSDDDVRRGKEEELGTALARAQRFTRDERNTFARTLLELYNQLARAE